MIFKSIVRKLTNQYTELQYTDVFLEHTVNNKLNDIYFNSKNQFNNMPKGGKFYDFKSQGSEEREGHKIFESKGQTVKNYSYPFSYSLPFSDGAFEQWFTKNSCRCVPSQVDFPSHSRVTSETEQALQRFGRRVPSLKRTEASRVIEAGIEAAETLGISRVLFRKRRTRATGSGFQHAFQAQKRKFNPLTVGEAIERGTKSTSAGWPTLEKKTSSASQKDVSTWVPEFLRNPRVYSIFKNPCIIFIRFQPIVENFKDAIIKIRQVYGVPFRVVVLENVFFGEILDNYFQHNLNSESPVSSSSLTNHQISTRIVSRLRSYLDNTNGRSLYSMDYSKFDSTVPPFAIDIFFLICQNSLEMSETYFKAFHLLRFYVKYTPVVWKRRLFLLCRGIPSGLLITNLFDSWWNLTLWYLARKVIHNNGSRSFENFNANSLNYFFTDRSIVSDYLPPREDLAVCGDDVLIYTYEHEILIHKLICDRYFMNININIVCNSSNDNTFFLGRYWDKDSVPIQSEVYISTHLMIRTRWYRKEDVSFDISEDLDINRFLSIVCPLGNGNEYIRKYFMYWPPLIKFVRSSGGFTLLKDDWIGSGDRYIRGADVFNWKSY